MHSVYLWYGSAENCHPCDAQNTSLWHNLLLGNADPGSRMMTEDLEERRSEAIETNPSISQWQIDFIWQEAQVHLTSVWLVHVPTPMCQTNRCEIVTKSLRPDMVLWSNSVRVVIMLELTVPWEEGTEVAFERKKKKNNKLSVACTGAGWKVSTYPVILAAEAWLEILHNNS